MPCEQCSTPGPLHRAGLKHRSKECQLPQGVQTFGKSHPGGTAGAETESSPGKEGQKEIFLFRAVAGLSTHLQRKGLAREAGAQADAVHVVCVGDVVLNAMQDPLPGGRLSPMDASLADGPSCHTCLGIDVLQGRDGESKGYGLTWCKSSREDFPQSQLPSPFPKPRLNLKQLTGKGLWAQTLVVPTASQAPNQHCQSLPGTPVCGCRCQLSRTSPAPQY